MLQWHNVRMPQFILTPACKRLMADAGVSEADLLGGDGQACSSISRDVSRLIMARWRPNDRIILIDGPIKKASQFEGRPIVEIVESVLVLALTPDLPAGRITGEGDLEELLALVAESFGVPMRGHPDEPFSTLYSGPFAGKHDMQKDGMFKRDCNGDGFITKTHFTWRRLNCKRHISI